MSLIKHSSARLWRVIVVGAGIAGLSAESTPALLGITCNLREVIENRWARYISKPRWLFTTLRPSFIDKTGPFFKLAEIRPEKNLNISARTDKIDVIEGFIRPIETLLGWFKQTQLTVIRQTTRFQNAVNYFQRGEVNQTLLGKIAVEK